MTIHDIRRSDAADGAGDSGTGNSAAATKGAEDLFRIGTVASLTGIAVERLRAWERRYGLKPAHRDGKTRFYSSSQLERLKKLKTLSDHGHPISSIVELTDEQLSQRLAGQRKPALEAGKRITTGLIGPNLLVLEQQQSDSPLTEVAGRWANMAAFCSDQQATAALDVIVVQLPVLLDRHIENISRLSPNSRIVAVYQFATPRELASVEERGVPTLPWPASWADIEDTAISSAVLPASGGWADERRYSDDELIAIAVSAADDSTGCTQHLVDMITQLNALAEYSEELAVSDVALPDRFERVQTDVCQARQQLELALAALLGEAESDENA